MANDNRDEITVLYVDPDADFATRVSEQIPEEDDRISVQTAESVREALEYSVVEIDCIVSEYDLPDQSGITFLETIRSDRPGLPFVLYTEAGSEEVASQAIGAGVSDYLQKADGSEHFNRLASRIVDAVRNHRIPGQPEQSIEQQLIELAIDLLSADRADIDDQIDTALHNIARLVDADRSYVFQIDDAGNISNTHEWTSQGVESYREELQDIPQETFPWLKAKLQNLENVIIFDVSGLPPGAENLKAELQEENIQSMIAVPMVMDGELAGFIGFDWVKQQISYSPEFVDILQLAGQLIANGFRRERRDRELERTNDIIEQAQEIANLGAWETDLKREEGWWTKEVSRIFGLPEDYEPDPGEGIEYFHPEDRPAIREAFEDAIEDGQAYDLELRVKRADDTIRWVRTRGKPLFEDGEVVRVRGTLRDITQRKERERELTRYETIVENVDDIVLVVDQGGQIEYVNPAMSTHSDVSPDELVGTDIEQSARKIASSEENAKRWVDGLERALAAEQRLDPRLDTEGAFPISVEVEFDLPGGTFVADQRISPLFRNDATEGAVVIARDITERKERERQIRELKDRYQSFVEYSSDIITVTETDGTITYESPAVERVLGYDTDRPVGKNIFEHIHPEDRQEVKSHFMQLQRDSDRTERIEFRFKHKNGTYVWLESIGTDRTDTSIDGFVIYSRDITERKERERKIQRLNERVELAVQGANLGVWDWDITTDEVEYNDQWAEMLGYSLDEIEPHIDSWKNRVHPDDISAAEQSLEAHIEAESPYYESEHRMETADGDYKWVRDIGRVVERDENGEPTRAVGVHLDIEERKKREQQLRQFREAVEQTAHAVFITDTDGTIEYVNPAFEEVTGYSEDEAIGRNPRILSSGEYDDEYYDEFWKTILEGERWKDEIIDTGADDERIVLNQSISPIVDDEGNPRKFVAVAQDITQRKEYEQELERTRKELREVIDLVPDLIFAKNRDGEYLLANEATAQAYGLSPAEIEGRTDPAIIPDADDAEQFRKDDIEVIESGEAKSIPDEELITADGETRIFQTTKIPFKIPGGDEDAVLGYARDVTELKEYERRLERQRDNLEMLNQVVRHDIRNDLQVVLSYVETLREYVDESGEEYILNVLEATRDSIEITQTARDVTEMMLKSDVDLLPVKLGFVLEEEIEGIRASHEHALITVEGSISDVEVIADDMLESIFRNLLHNAIHHNDREVPEVTVSTNVEDEHVEVRIADNGPGIPDERKDKIFEQGEAGLESEGTGLGLYLVDTLVDRYGGDVRVEDNDSSGSVFVVQLPRAE